MLDWNIMVHYFPFLLKATILTLEISLLSLVLGLIFGLSAALCKLARNPFLRMPATFYIWLIRSTPLLVQLFIIYFGFPQLGIDLGPFMSGVLGLALNVGAYNAETIRGGIISVPRGQTEAARSLGMTINLSMRRIILPQALRVIIPPLTSQMLNLTKNSSLAVAIGYPDFVSVAGTVINQTGQAIEGVLLIMIVYLFFSLSTSAFMNWYNQKMAIVER